MNTPSPKDMPQHKPAPSTDTLEASPIVDEKTKPVFVRKPHLTDRPLKNDPRLLALKSTLTVDETSKAFKNVGRQARNAGKSVRQFNEAHKSNRQYPTSKK